MTATEKITVRMIMPDRWLEHVVELPAGVSISEAKAVGIREMLQRTRDDPSDFYTEYEEREIVDESRSLEQVGVRQNGVLSIRAYDLGHHPRYRG
ncbi:MAG: hypothetical protein OEU54_01125 [Gemmatimonadota bacterium]|nr:hypothetical protein [Gemmatimonadota bacterium]